MSQFRLAHVFQHVNDYGEEEEDDDNDNTSDFPTNMEILLRTVGQ